MRQFSKTLKSSHFRGLREKRASRVSRRCSRFVCWSMSLSKSFAIFKFKIWSLTSSMRLHSMMRWAWKMLHLINTNTIVTWTSNTRLRSFWTISSRFLSSISQSTRNHSSLATWSSDSPFRRNSASCLRKISKWFVTLLTKKTFSKSLLALSETVW